MAMARTVLRKHTLLAWNNSPPAYSPRASSLTLLCSLHQQAGRLARTGAMDEQAK